MSCRTSRTPLKSSLLLLTGAALVFLAGCVMVETYGGNSTPENERAEVEGYWHYRFLYDEELHIASVDGKRDERSLGWPYAYSISLPAGKHWLQIAILRNSGTIAKCAFDWTFEARHHYKFERLDHGQVFLAHPVSSPYPATIVMQVTAPSKAVETVKAPVVCGEEAMCRQDSDCVPNQYCQVNPTFTFGSCKLR